MAELRSEELALELLQQFDSGTAQLLRLAGSLRRLDDLEGAVEHLESARRLVGNDAMVDSCLGVVLTFQGQLEAALRSIGEPCGRSRTGRSRRSASS